MFRGLRVRLTLLYLSVALLLIAILGLGTYALINRYLQSTTDLALQHKMAHEFRSRGIEVPPELAAADRNWYDQRSDLFPRLTQTGSSGENNSDDEESTHDDESGGSAVESVTEEVENEETYDGELSAIFVLPLSADGGLLSTPGSPQPPFTPDNQAVSGALSTGTDWRTVSLDNGARIRLLTYRLPAGHDEAALQLGRTLGDQDRVLEQLLVVLLALGAVGVGLMGIGSWWLAGRSLRPAQEAWARQQAFVANASHELRTPLTLVRASAEVALRTLPTGDIQNRELMADVVQECDHMGSLVEDLLLLSRLDAGRLQLERKSIPVSEILAAVQRQVGRVAEERGVSLSARSTEGTVWGDPTRLRQVLLILLDNALRHTPTGGSIWLESRLHGRFTELTVADNGSGIAPEHLPHIFERFYRAASTPDGKGSSGLGLAIARGLVEAQHGQISVESRPGQGTRVKIALPSAS